MITEKEVRSFRLFSKSILDYMVARRTRKRAMNNFFFHNYKLLDLVPENLDKQMELKYKMVFQYAWDIAEKKFRNAEAAEILDIDDNINETLHILRLKKKDSSSPDSIKAYEDAINIVKELKVKLPKRMVRL